jgi:hypothetical protein
MKKFLSIFIALAMVLSLFAGVGARTAKAAAGAATVTVGSATLAVGVPAQVDVTAVIPASSNIGSMQFVLYYDSTKISLAATAGDLPDVFVANSAVANKVTVVGIAHNLTAGFAGPTVVLAHLAVTALAGFTTGTTPITLSGVALTDASIPSNTYTNTLVNGTMTALVGPVRTLTGIAITPNPANVVINTAQQFVVTGTYNVIPLTANLTASAVWSANAPNGYFVGMTLGQFAVTASYGGFNSFAVVNVSTTPLVIVPVTTTTSTLGITTTGTFVGGADGSGVAGVNGIGKVVSITDANTAVVNVTTAAAGSFDTANGVKLLHIFTAGATISANWYNTGSQLITFNPAEPTFVLGQTITVGASGTPGSGKITSINPAGTTAYVNVTTAAVGIFDGNVYTRTLYIPSIDPDWMTVGATQVITIPTAGMGQGDLLTAYMTQAVPATSATAFFMVTGTPVVGDVATITFQDSAAASHTVTYTTKAGDTAATVAQTLSQLIDALDTASGYNLVYSTYTVGASVVQLTQENAGTVGNGKTLTGTTTAAVVPTLTIHTLGGLNSPAYVELGKTIKLVAVDATGAVVSCTWTSVGSAAPAGPSAVVNASGLVTADLALTGVTVVTAKSGSATGVFAVVVIPVQTITSLKINLVPAVPVSTTSQQFGVIASNAAYSALDYTTQAVWTSALKVATIAPTTGIMTYSTDETGNVLASAGGITATANVKIATGVVTLVPVVGPVTKVIVLTIGSDIVTVDGKATTVDAAPEIVDGRTFVPIRFIAETFGSTVTWLPDTKGVTIVLGDTTIGLQIGNATAVINGTILALDAAPYIKNSRTMVPLRVITESFGGNVAWDPINHIITITYVLPVVPAA